MASDALWPCHQVSGGGGLEHAGHVYLPLALWTALCRERGVRSSSIIELFTVDKTFYGIAFPAFTRHPNHVQIHDATFVEATNDLPEGVCRVGRVWRVVDKSTSPVQVDEDDSVDLSLLHARLMGKVIVDGALVGTGRRHHVRVKTEATNPFFCLSTTILVRQSTRQSDASPGLEYVDDGAYDQMDAIVKATIRIQTEEALRHLCIPQGILLSGPPGVGKTHLVRCVARNNQIPLHVVNGPEVVSTSLGQSEENLCQAFAEAERKALACDQRIAILFFDEIDSIAGRREEHQRDSQAVRLLGQLLVLLDGVQGRSRSVIFVGATNRPNAIDAAVRRPGRLDREIAIEPPKEPVRLRLLALLLKGIPLAEEEEVSVEELAGWTHGYVPADLCALVRHLLILSSASSQPIDREMVSKGMAKIPPSLLREYRLPSVVEERGEESWDDLGGLDEVKARVQEAVEWPLLYPEAFGRLGIRPVRGVLLHGPPGCSKTSIARILAASNRFSFFSLDGATVFSCYVGEAERLIRTVFASARRAAPSLIFLDEVDTLVGVRGQGADQVQERVLSTLLNEMDGIVELTGVIVLGATNRPELIDSALLRPGRFDCIVAVPPPNAAGRLDILQRVTRRTPLAPDVDLRRIAEESEGFSGAMLRQMVQEAAINAIRDDQSAVSMQHFYHRLHATNRASLSVPTMLPGPQRTKL